MSLDSTIHVGYYVVAKMKEITVTDTEAQCSLNPKHHILDSAAFCSKCGGKIEALPVQRSVFQSLLDVMYDVTDFAENMPEADKRFLLDKFEGVESEWVGYNVEGCEIVLLSEFNSRIDGDYSSVNDLGTNAPSNQQVIAYLARLKQIMQYESVEIHYGVLVQYA